MQKQGIAVPIGNKGRPQKINGYGQILDQKHPDRSSSLLKSSFKIFHYEYYICDEADITNGNFDENTGNGIFLDCMSFCLNAFLINKGFPTKFVHDSFRNCQTLKDKLTLSMILLVIHLET